MSLLIVRHNAPLRVVGEAEVLTPFSADELRAPRSEVVVDSRVLVESVEGGHWRPSDEFVRHTAAELRSRCAETPGELHYFSMAEVPHVVGIAAHFGDETLVHAHDYDRDRDTWAWRNGQAVTGVEMIGIPRELVSQPGEAVLVVEVSYPISQSDVDAVIGDETLATIRVSASPELKPGIIQSPADVATVRDRVREALAAIAQFRPGSRVIHLFIAAPVSVCFAVGQELRLRNGPDVMTYRYRAATEGPRYARAILLTSRGLGTASRVVTDAERPVAEHARTIFARALGDVKAHAAQLSSDVPWYTSLEPRAMLEAAQPFKTLVSLVAVVNREDCVSPEPRPTDYGFVKERPRTWWFSDALLLSFVEAAGGHDDRVRQLARLFFYHEYLHDWQDLTKYTAEDVGSFANCLEAIDYMADTYALLHQVDYAIRFDGVLQLDAQRFLADQIGLAISSFWAFESIEPNFEWQERRLRRYMNWYWRRVQVREAPSLDVAVRTLSRRPNIEIAGFKYRTGSGRQFVVLNEKRPGDIPELGIVLEDGRFDRRGTTTDLSIEAVMKAFGERDPDAIDRFFNSLFEHLRATGAVFAE